MKTHPRRVMYAFGFQFILMTLRAQLSGVIQERFNPFRKTSLIAWVVLGAHILHVWATGNALMDEATMYLGLDLSTGVALGHFIYFAARELMEILDINLLSMTQKQIANQAAIIKSEREAAAKAFKDRMK